jgi:alkanesulfonate monooxygenase SsuD/methylene tetrahydromethanopterin reductase-like flavin-dependent oxidoreductase (luciferase family)
MKAACICFNGYTDGTAWTMGGDRAPRGAFDADIGRRTLAQTLAQARLADSLGFDYITVSEHHAMPLMPSPNAAVLAGAISQVVSTAGIAWLGPIVSINHPLRVAEEIAMLDQLTGGRLIVCLLRGTAEEWTVYNNIDPQLSKSITDEAAVFIRRALAEREPFDHRGEHFDLPNVSVWPGQTQTPHPPLYTSGMSHESARFTARNHFSLAISFYRPELVTDLTDVYRAECAASGWTPTDDDILYRSCIVVGRSDAEADDMAGRFWPSSPPPTPDSIFSPRWLTFCGGPESVTEQIREFHQKTGTGMLDLCFGMGGFSHDETLASIRRFGEHVLPRMRELTTRPQHVPDAVGA